MLGALDSKSSTAKSKIFLVGHSKEGQKGILLSGADVRFLAFAIIIILWKMFHVKRLFKCRSVHQLFSSLKSPKSQSLSCIVQLRRIGNDRHNSCCLVFTCSKWNSLHRTPPWLVLKTRQFTIISAMARN